MMNRRVAFEELIEQIERIPAEWMNGTAEQVVEVIPWTIDQLDSSPLDKSLIEKLLVQEAYTLDVFRLFLDLSQDSVANEINSRGIRGDFNSIRRKCKDQAAEIADVLVEELGLIDTIEAHRIRKWTLEDILKERYKQMRGRAIRGQRRGAAVENAVEDEVLKELEQEIGLSYESRLNFVNSSGEEAKADFMIPSHKIPRIVIEAKGYEATGSKLTDVLGDILKILQVKDNDTFFFLVTDGIGWYRRLSDLRKIVDYHQTGEIDMIYTRKTLSDLNEDIKSIMQSDNP